MKNIIIAGLILGSIHTYAYKDGWDHGHDHDIPCKKKSLIVKPTSCSGYVSCVQDQQARKNIDIGEITKHSAEIASKQNEIYSNITNIKKNRDSLNSKNTELTEVVGEIGKLNSIILNCNADVSAFSKIENDLVLSLAEKSSENMFNKETAEYLKSSHIRNLKFNTKTDLQKNTELLFQDNIDKIALLLSEGKTNQVDFIMMSYIYFDWSTFQNLYVSLFKEKNVTPYLLLETASFIEKESQDLDDDIKNLTMSYAVIEQSISSMQKELKETTKRKDESIQKNITQTEKFKMYEKKRDDLKKEINEIIPGNILKMEQQNEAYTQRINVLNVTSNNHAASIKYHDSMIGGGCARHQTINSQTEACGSSEFITVESCGAFTAYPLEG